MLSVKSLCLLNISERLVYLSQPLPDNPDFVLYCLLTGLTEAINTCFWLHKDLLRQTLYKKNPKFEKKKLTCLSEIDYNRA
jgi:hypothetical protein